MRPVYVHRHDPDVRFVHFLEAMRPETQQHHLVRRFAYDVNEVDPASELREPPWTAAFASRLPAERERCKDAQERSAKVRELRVAAMLSLQWVMNAPRFPLAGSCRWNF